MSVPCSVRVSVRTLDDNSKVCDVCLQVDVIHVRHQTRLSQLRYKAGSHGPPTQTNRLVFWRRRRVDISQTGGDRSVVFSREGVVVGPLIGGGGGRDLNAATEIAPQLPWSVNRKPYARFRTVSLPMTLNDSQPRFQSHAII